jgi:DNA topoisomerase IA
MIVESPTKATKIQKFLGDQYQVGAEAAREACRQQSLKHHLAAVAASQVCRPSGPDKHLVTAVPWALYS